MSKSKQKSINFSIYEFMKGHKGKMSHATYADRTNRLVATCRDLHKLGYEPTHIGRIKPKHVEVLVKYWQSNGASVGTIKNRMSDLRFVCREFNRANVVKDNDEYQIGKRSYVPSKNKALHAPNFEKVDDDYIRCSIELQRAFGLRREECLKIIPSQADEGTLLRLQASWTKGGITRAIPITNSEQRYWLDKAKELVGNRCSMIPEGKSYIQQRQLYDRVVSSTGHNNLHGLRHAYAQKRYREITGWPSPIDGGKTRTQLSKQQREIDLHARKIVSFELGHSRIAIAKNYLG
ncbi:MAG: integrase domain-containing protein [Legionellales bacterium]|nr:integrase domain-containing protein [Legionellales bacterium]